MFDIPKSKETPSAADELASKDSADKLIENITPKINNIKIALINYYINEQLRRTKYF